MKRCQLQRYLKFAAAFLSAILLIGLDVKVKAAQPRPRWCVATARLFLSVSWAGQLCCATPDTKDEGPDCLQGELRELSAFPCAILNDTTALEFVSAGDDAKAVRTSAVTKERTLRWPWQCSPAPTPAVLSRCANVHSCGRVDSARFWRL